MTNKEIVRELAKRFRERATALRLVGKKRDDAALDYFVGAATSAEIQGHAELAKHIATISSMLVAVRGYLAVSELADKRD